MAAYIGVALLSWLGAYHTPENGCVYRGCALLSNGADDVETVHAIKTIEDCLWKQYPQY